MPRGSGASRASARCSDSRVSTTATTAPTSPPTRVTTSFHNREATCTMSRVFAGLTDVVGGEREGMERRGGGGGGSGGGELGEGESSRVCVGSGLVVC